MAEVQGWLCRTPLLFEDSVLLEVMPIAVFQSGRRVAYSTRLQLRVYDGDPHHIPKQALIGGRLRFTGFLMEAGFYATPGVRDNRRRLWSQGIRHQVRLKSWRQLRWQGTQPGWGWLKPLFRYIDRFQDHCRTLAPPAPLLLTGVLLGNPPSDPEWRKRLERLGIWHLFVVSGFHVGLVLWFLHRVLSRLGIAGALLALFAMWLYVLVTGWTLSSIRAGLMASLFYVLLRVGVRRSFFNSIGLAALVLLVAHPASLFNAGFQYSFLSLLALGVFLLPHLRGIEQACQGMRDLGSETVLPGQEEGLPGRRRIRFLLEEHFGFLPRPWHRLFHWSGGLASYLVPLAVGSLGVQLAALPLTLYHSNQAPLIQTAANFLLMPAMGLLVPLGLLLLALYPTPLGAPLSWLIERYAALLELAARALDRMSIELFLPHPGLGECLAYWGLLGAAWLACRKGRFGRDRSRRLPRSLVALLAAMPFLVLAGGLCLPRSGEDSRFRLTLLDVGQGEALHLAYPDGSHSLIDCGGQSPPSEFEDWVGRRVTARYFWENRIRRLSFLLCTHPHLDHAGGCGFIRERFPPASILVFEGGPCEATLPKGPTAFAGLAFEVAGVEHRVLHPGREASLLEPNDRSLVLWVRHGDITFLLAGDIEATAERALAPGLTSVSILKVPHHGAAGSSSRDFLDALRPQVALISAGRLNRFGHPSPAALSRLEQAGIPWFSTSRWGTLRVVSDGRRWSLWRYDLERGRFVEILSQG